MDKLIITSIIIFILSISLSFIINLLIIKINKRKHKLNIERKYLYFHNNKKNIPFLGGISIIITSIITFIIYSIIYNFDEVTFISLISIILYGLIGFLDDLMKIKKKNSDGISPLFRLFLESIFAIFIIYLLGFNYEIFKYLNINGLKIGLFSFPLFIFLFIGGANASNIVDGIDGLDAGLTLIALTPNIILSFNEGYYIYGLFLLSIIGSLIGFLFLNSHPAKIFLGDTGSLALGNIIILSSIILNNIILIPLIMFLFIIETLSIIIQVLYYKKTKKRIFLMAPLHHHFEMKKIEESKIVMSFYLIGIILSIISIFIRSLI